MIYSILQNLKVGEVRAFEQSGHALVFDDASSTNNETDFRVISLNCSNLPSIENLIDLFLEECAKIALAIWPRWFGLLDETRFQNKNAFGHYLERESFFHSLSRAQSDILKSWLKDSIAACSNHQPPIFEHYPKATQIFNLAKAIHLDHLYILILVEGHDASESRLYGLVKAAEWFASNAQASVGLLVDPALVQHPDLSSVIFQQQEWIPNENEKRFQDSEDEETSTIWPIVGAPHPFSPGEQLLAKRLKQDPELGALFGFNQRVMTTRNSHYLVDLLWEQGKVVVEVDGYRYHSNRSAFFSDRQRDYELLISGYQVLRLDHAEVTSDVDLCLEKIRDVVRLNKTNSESEGNQ